VFHLFCHSHASLNYLPRPPSTIPLAIVLKPTPSTPHQHRHNQNHHSKGKAPKNDSVSKQRIQNSTPGAVDGAVVSTKGRHRVLLLIVDRISKSAHGREGGWQAGLWSLREYSVGATGGAWRECIGYRRKVYSGGIQVGERSIGLTEPARR
jgi:hypothetical protein